MSQLIRQLFLIAWDLWADRNNIRHHTPTPATQRETDRLNQELREELRFGGTDLPHDQEFFHVAETEALRWDNPTKRQYIATLDVIRQAHALHDPHENDGMAQERSSMSNWLGQ